MIFQDINQLVQIKFFMDTEGKSTGLNLCEKNKYGIKDTNSDQLDFSNPIFNITRIDDNILKYNYSKETDILLNEKTYMFYNWKK